MPRNLTIMLYTAMLLLSQLALAGLPARFVYKTQVTHTGDGISDTVELIGESGAIVSRLTTPWPSPLSIGDQLRLVRHGKTVSLLQNERVVAELSAKNLTEIRLGSCFAEGRLQRSEAIAFGDDFMRDNNELGQWTVQAGQWNLDRIPNPTWSANAFRLRADGNGLLTAGYGFWHDIGMRAAIRPGPETQGAGVAVGVSKSSSLTMRWFQQKPAYGEFQLVATDNGSETIIARQAGRFDTSQWTELALLVHGRRAWAYVDDVLVFSEPLASVPIGQVGLWTQTAAHAQFDDVVVRSMPFKLGDMTDGLATARAVFGPDRVVIPQRMANDSYMVGWSTDRANWRAWTMDGATAWRWHIGVLDSDTTVTWQTPPLTSTIYQACQPGDRESGYSLTLAPETMTLSRQGVVLASAPRPAGRLTWERHKGRQVVSISGKEVLTIADPSPLTGNRLAVAIAAESQELIESLPVVESASIHDYTFYTAPVDWRVATGHWEITSRWICTPDWSWFGGTGEEAATIWSKQRYSGDQTVDLTSAVMMSFGVQRQGLPFGYRRRGDLNFSFCADGKSLSSGYTVMFGGFNNSRTCLWKGDRIVAERSDRLYPIKKGKPLHKSWFNVRAEKTGSRIVVYLNDEAILEYVDPEPLEAGKVAIWTWDSGIMIPRARVFAETTKTPASAFLPPAPGIQTGDRYSAFLDEQDGVKTFTNPQSGGNLKAPLGLAPFEAGTNGRLHFFYRLPPELKVHLYLKVDDQDFYVAMTAREDPETHHILESEQIAGRTLPKSSLTGQARIPVRLGTLHIIADNAWHDAELDLTSLLQPFFAHSPTLTVSELYMGNWSCPDYLMCGFGGNPAGVAWSLKDVKLNPTIRQVATGKWRTDGPYPVKLQQNADSSLLVGAGPNGGRAIVLKQLIDTVRYPQLAFEYRRAQSAPVQLEVRQTGAWKQLPLQNLVADSTWHALTVPLFTPGPTCIDAIALEYPEDLAFVERSIQIRNLRTIPATRPPDSQPPALVSISPANNATSSAGKLHVVLNDEGVGLDLASLALTINGQVFTLSDPDASFDPTTQTFSVSLAQPPPDGTTMLCRIEAADRAGNTLIPVDWSWTMSYASDTVAPPAPYVAYIPSDRLVWESFEEDLGEWQSRRGGYSNRSELQAATGSYCCETSGFSVFARYSPFDARQFPIVRVDYRLAPQATCNWIFLVNNHNYELRFNSPQNKNEMIGELPGIIADGHWHRAEFDLTEIFSKLLVEDEPLIIEHIAFFNRKQEGRWFDNFSVASRRETAPRFEWSIPSDASGITGYSISYDDQPGTIPDETVDTTDLSWQLTDAPEGIGYLHVRARDGAGNWGAPGHAKVVIQP